MLTERGRREAEGALRELHRVAVVVETHRVELVELMRKCLRTESTAEVRDELSAQEAAEARRVLNRQLRAGVGSEGLSAAPESAQSAS